MSKKNNAQQIHITRIYDAPVKAVWEAWTDPVQTAQWWGPRGFTLTTHSKELRPGGHWHYTMHGPDGTDYINKTKYFEVEEYAKLVYDHGGNDEHAPLFRVTVLFSERNGQTTMEMTMTLPSFEAAEETRTIIKKAGGEATWDRLAEFLEEKSSGLRKFVINRSFDVPRHILFEMWSKPEYLSKWLPPTGFDMEFIRADITSGGSSFYVMNGANNMKMYGRAEYKRVESPELLVYTQQFCDENENISRHPLAPIWPKTMLTTVTMSEEGSNRTRVTIVWEIFGFATTEETEMFVKSRSGMTQGWSGSFEKLEAYLGIH